MSRVLLDENSTNPGPWVRATDVQHTVFAKADVWGGATVSIEISPDGEAAVGDALMTFTADGYDNATLGRRTFIRARHAGGSPSGLKVTLAGG